MEVEKLRTEVVSMCLSHAVKTGETGESFFKAMDKDGDGVVSKADFLAFCESCEKRPESLGSPELERVFSSLCATASDSLNKEEVLRLVKVYYKVIKEAVLTDVMVIKESKSVRRLEVGEIFEVLEGPEKEEQSQVDRVRGRALKDGSEGFATVAGNQGTVFLSPGGDTLVVAAPDGVELCESQELAENGESEESHGVVRRLAHGEALRLTEWPLRREEKSGAPTRIKVQAQSDGAIGWVTASTPTTVFIKVA